MYQHVPTHQQALTQKKEEKNSWKDVPTCTNSSTGPEFRTIMFLLKCSSPSHFSSYGESHTPTRRLNHRGHCTANLSAAKGFSLANYTQSRNDEGVGRVWYLINCTVWSHCIQRFCLPMKGMFETLEQKCGMAKRNISTTTQDAIIKVKMFKPSGFLLPIKLKEKKLL